MEGEGEEERVCGPFPVGEPLGLMRGTDLRVLVCYLGLFGRKWPLMLGLDPSESALSLQLLHVFRPKPDRVSLG